MLTQERGRLCAPSRRRLLCAERFHKNTPLRRLRLRSTHHYNFNVSDHHVTGSGGRLASCSTPERVLPDDQPTHAASSRSLVNDHSTCLEFACLGTNRHHRQFTNATPRKRRQPTGRRLSSSGFWHWPWCQPGAPSTGQCEQQRPARGLDARHATSKPTPYGAINAPRPRSRDHA